MDLDHARTISVLTERGEHVEIIPDKGRQGGCIAINDDFTNLDLDEFSIIYKAIGSILNEGGGFKQ